jgi:hypothetical protein
MCEFIEVYRSLPALWQVKSNEYCDRNKRNEAYDILVAKYQEVAPNADVETVRKKINSLRTNYRKKKVNITCSAKSGCGGAVVYIPSL